MSSEHKLEIERWFKIGMDLAEKVMTKRQSLTPMPALDEEDAVYKETMVFFFCKAYKSYQAIKVLWREGFAEDAFILTRTLFEIALQEGYMKLDPKPRARLFTEYDPVMRYRFYQKLKKLPDANMLQAIGSRAHDLLVLKQQHDRLKTKYPEGKSWLGEPIAWLARQLGKGAEAEYMSV